MADSPESQNSGASQSQSSVQYTPSITSFTSHSTGQIALQKTVEEVWKTWVDSPYDDDYAANIIHDYLRWPRDPNSLTLVYTDCQGWIRAYDDKKKKFIMEPNHFLVVCDRCHRVYCQDMSEVDLNGLDPALPSFQLSFAFCPANINGSCYKDRQLDWVLRRERIKMCYNDSALKTMDALRVNGLPTLIGSVFGLGRWHELPFEVRLRSAYKALRIHWIRSFSAYEQNCRRSLVPGQLQPAASLIPDVPEAAESQARFWNQPKVIEHGNKQLDLQAVWLHMTYGELPMWGDVQYDLNLFYDGWIKESELLFVYGMKREALEFLQLHGWERETEYLNAYAGMRHRVAGDHYFLMRTACQRAATAMDRVLDACAAGCVFKPGCKKLYALSGMRFQEILSSLCADLNVLRAAARAFEKPLDASWWKSRTEIVGGKRVEVAYVTTHEALSKESK